MLGEASYHFRRAQDEFDLSHRAADSGAAAAHRALSILHLGRLMNSSDAAEREEASAMLAIIEQSSPPEPARSGPARSLFWKRPAEPPQPKLVLRYKG